MEVKKNNAFLLKITTAFRATIIILPIEFTRVF